MTRFRNSMIVAGTFVALSVICSAPALAVPVVLNFDELTGTPVAPGVLAPSTSRLSDGYLSTYGIVFSSGSPFVAVVNLGIGHATSGAIGIAGTRPTGVQTYDAGFPVVMTFFDPANPSQRAVTDFISVRGDRAGSGAPIALEAFDIDGILLASYATADSGGATLSISAPGIHSARFIGTADSYGVGIDDVTFNPVTPVGPAVPEPASILLLASGLARLGWSTRRRRAARKE